MLAAIVAAAAVAAGLPEGCVSLVAGGGREELAELATQTGSVDLIIPRGGEGLKAALQAVATVPVIYAASGNCHVYVDAGADLEHALAIVLNAKVQRPGVCNAAETLLVHESLADEFVPLVLEALGDAGVLVRADEHTIARAGGEPGAASQQLAGAVVEPAGEEDFATEYLAPIIAVAIVERPRAGDRAHRPPRQRPLRGDRHPRHRRRRAPSGWGWTPPACTSTPPPASPTGASSGWVRRSATPRRSSTPAGRSGCASCAPSSTSLKATGTSALERGAAPPAPASVGILGGTFNPPHLGHLRIARRALEQLRLERVLLMPARMNPLKPGEQDPGAGTGCGCASCCARRAADLARVPPSSSREGPSYHRRDPAELHALATRPSAGRSSPVPTRPRTLPRWRDPAGLLGLAALAVAARAGSEPRAGARAALGAGRTGGDGAQAASVPGDAADGGLLLAGARTRGARRAGGGSRRRAGRGLHRRAGPVPRAGGG